MIIYFSIYLVCIFEADKDEDLFWIKNYISLNGGEKPSFRREPTLKNTFKAQVAVVFA